MSSQENAFQGLFRSVVRADFYDPKSIGPLKLVPDSLRGEHVVDSIFVRPSWIVPGIRSTITDYRGMEEQTYHLGRSSDYFNNTYGIDFRNSPLRDWNEEIQSARDMPRETLQDRMDRAKVIHKVLSDFADASVTGAMAIFGEFILHSCGLFKLASDLIVTPYFFDGFACSSVYLTVFRWTFDTYESQRAHKIPCLSAQQHFLFESCRLRLGHFQSSPRRSVCKKDCQ